MTCRARYRGLRPVFGIDKSSTYTLGLSTEPSANDNEYVWVSIDELPEYLMPYGSITALTMDWDFSVETETACVDQLDTADRWLDVYIPKEETA